MLKKIISLALAALLCTPLAATAAQSEKFISGFTGGGITWSANEYFMDDFRVILVENKEAFEGIDYEDLHAGSYLLLPLMVYVNGARDYTAVTDKMIKNDNVTFSYKVMRGANCVEELTIVDGKKLKLAGVNAGSYIKIPFASNYSLVSKTSVSIQLVLSVNDVTYQETQLTLNCRLGSYVTEITKNTVYGAKTPTLFRAGKSYQGEATFDFGNEIKYTSKVKKEGVYFLSLSREKNDDIAGMYPGAHLDFYNFLGDRKSFSSVGKLEIPVNVSSLAKKGEAASLYVYRIDGMTLIALSTGAISFNKVTNKLTINTKTLGSYVLSNQPLSRTVTPAESDILKSGYAS